MGLIPLGCVVDLRTPLNVILGQQRKVERTFSGERGPGALAHGLSGEDLGERWPPSGHHEQGD